MRKVRYIILTKCLVYVMLLAYFIINISFVLNKCLDEEDGE